MIPKTSMEQTMTNHSVFCIAILVFLTVLSSGASSQIVMQSLEPSCAASPTNPNNIVFAFSQHDFRLGYWNPAAWGTLDGGATWYFANLYYHDNRSINARAAFASDGSPVVSYLTYNGQANPDVVYYCKSGDGGQNYNGPYTLFSSSLGSAIRGFAFAIDNTPNGAYYYVWPNYIYDNNNTANLANGIEFYSTAGGGIRQISSDMGCGTNIVIDGNHNVYVAWCDFNGNVRIIKSNNGGSSWGSVTTVVSGLTNPGTVGGFPAAYYPSLAVDLSLFHQNRIYITYHSGPSTDVDVYSVFSDDGGSTWSSPKKVNNDNGQGGKLQWLPWATVDNLGTVHIVFYDNRNGNGANIQAFEGTSLDGGLTYTNVPIESALFSLLEPPGDHLAATSNGNWSVLAWVQPLLYVPTNTIIDQIQTTSTLPETFTNYVGQTVAGGKLQVNGGVTIVSQNSAGLFAGTSATEKTLGSGVTAPDRFTNYLTRTTSKHNNWNSTPSSYLLSSTFTVPPSKKDANQSAYFMALNPAAITTYLVDFPTLSSGSLSFGDPWFLNADGSQGNNSSLLVPINETHGITGAYNQSTGGLFLNQSGPGVGWISPCYSVSATSQPMAGHNSYFLNWSSVGVYLQNASASQTGVDFYGPSGDTVYANYKGSLLSSNTNAFATNGQRKFVRTNDGNLQMVYESAGHVWYEMSTDNGITWTLANGGHPLDVLGGKLPAIDCQVNDVAIVWQENLTGGGVRLNIARFLVGVMGTGYPLQAFIDPNQLYTQNLNPVIAYDYEERAMIAWENKGNYVLPIGICVEHGVLGSYATPPNWSYDYRQAISGTDVNCVNSTLAVAKNPNDQYNMLYQLAWQYNQSSSYSNIDYCQVTANTGGVTQSAVSTPSAGSGFWQNQQPSIAAMNDGSARLSWNGYVPWYGNRAVYNSSTYSSQGGVWSSTIMNMGTSVSQTIMSSNSDGTFVLGWVQNGGSFTNYFVKSDNLYAVKNFTTSGNNLQLNNGSSFGTMCGMAFQFQTVPYSFLQTNNVGSFAKTYPQSVSTGRAVVFSCAGKQYVVGIADITVGGKPVGFVPLNALPPLPTKDTLDQYLRTEAFQISSSSKVALTVFHGMINPVDTSDIVSTTDGNGPIGVQVLVSDASSGKQLGEIAQYQIADNQPFVTDISPTTVSLGGLSGTPNVQLVIRLNDQGHPQYTVNEFFSVGRAISLAKSDSSQAVVDIHGEKTAYSLDQSYPNPFNPSTQISYSLPEAGKVSLVIYDVLGREVATLADGYQESGRYSVTWNSTQNSGVPVSSGVYFARLRVLNDLGGVTFTKTTKLLLMK